MPSILEQRRSAAATRLQDIVREAEQMLARDDFDADHADYVALREERTRAQDQLADLDATLQARALAAAAPTPTGAGGEPISDFRRVLREYDRGHSDRVDLAYEIQRAYDVIYTGEPVFTPNPSRIQVAELPVITPALDSVNTVQTANTYDFVIPPPPVAAGGPIVEGSTKPRVEFKSSKVSGELETDAHILDVSRQTLEDDATAERTLRSWLATGVRLKQNAKVAAAIAGASGTLTASDSTALFAAIRKGKAELSKLGVMATGVHVNPDDAAEIDLEAMVVGHGGMTTNGSMWGLTVVENPGIPAGTAYVGALRQAVYLLYRSAIATYITDSGMTMEDTPRDRFSNNILGILGEGRSKVHVVQPKLLVKCTFTG